MRILISLFLLCMSSQLSAQTDTLTNSDSVSLNLKRQKFTDSVVFSLTCARRGNDGFQALYKENRIQMKGRFENWKLMCGITYVYDPKAMLIAVKVYEDGVFTREVAVPIHQ